MKHMLFILCSTMLFSAPAMAHHNWAAFFDVEGDIEIEAVIQSVEFRNPHVRVGFVTDDGTEYWTESNSVASLTRMGVTKELLAIGKKVRVAGYPSRKDDNGIFMNHMLIDGDEIIFLRTADPRWPEAERIGNTDVIHGKVSEDDFSKRPTTVFAVWSTIFGAQGSHQAMKVNPSLFQISYTEARGEGACTSKDVWTEMGSPYPMQIVDNEDGTLTIHVEEYDTIRTVYMNTEHNDTGDVKNNLGYSTGYFVGDTLFVTTSFEGSNSPIKMQETFTLSADHGRLNYSQTLINPESDELPSVNAKWWGYIPGSFVQPYDCI